MPEQIFKTESEEVFAAYLDGRGLKWEYELPAGSKLIDFWVDVPPGVVACEVKEINAPPPPSQTGFLDPYAKVSEAIKAKAEQGKALKGQCPFVVVIRKTSVWPVDEISVTGSMFGEINVAWTLNPEGGSAGDSHIAFGRDAMLQAEKNRVVSAVAILGSVQPKQD